MMDKQIRKTGIAPGLKQKLVTILNPRVLLNRQDNSN